MVSIDRSLSALGVTSLFAYPVIAAPSADSLSWVKANPQANAAAHAFAEVYSEAVAIGHPDPESYAYAASEDDCAIIGCHASCGLLIVEGQKCSDTNSYSGPYNNTCLCEGNTPFKSYYASCMNCGWTLWKYYGGYVSSPLASCSTLSTEQTGTLRCSTTLADSYIIDTGLQLCEYTGGCTASSTTSSASTSTSNSSSVTTSSTTQTSTTVLKVVLLLLLLQPHPNLNL